MSRGPAVSLMLAFCIYGAVSAQAIRAPKIWDDAALVDWATPVAGLNVRPSHYSAAEYYAAPAENLKTYPVYHPDEEPPGYWEWLQKQQPEPLVDSIGVRTEADWIIAGERAFREMNSALIRTNDPAIIAQARNPATFDRISKLPDGSVLDPRWVVTSQGVMLTITACARCHSTKGFDDRVTFGGPGGAARDGTLPLTGRVPLLGGPGTARRLQLFYTGDSIPTAFWRDFTVPWTPDQRIEQMRTMSTAQLGASLNGGRSFSRGVFARTNGSPFHVTKTMDLQNLRYSRYLDATATHRLRGPEDVARYAALVSGADPMDFGPHRILTDAQRRIRFRYADEVLYAIGMYLMSLEPPNNPTHSPPAVLTRGEQLFRREGCARCHPAPHYTNGKLTLAAGWNAPANHPNRADIMPVSVGTDAGAALETRKGTGFYKIPSLRGVWYRPLLLHDGSLTSLEEMFDAARLSPDYRPTGWNPPDATKRAVPGHTFGLSLNAEDKVSLLAFLRSL